MPLPKRSILITGASTPWGRKLASILEDDPQFDPIIGIDFAEPEIPFKRLRFFRLAPPHPLIAECIRTAQIDTVCHMLFLDTYRYNEDVFQLNVMGTMDLLAACVAGQVERVILVSDSKVYGADYTHPNFISEETVLNGSFTHQYLNDRLEIERIVKNFAVRHRRPRIAVLRVANVLCRSVDTPVGRYFDSAVVPTVLGYDPLLQFTHETDLLGAVARTAASDIDGIVNISGEGVLPLSQVLRIGRKIPLPLPDPFMHAGSRLLKSARVLESTPLEIGFLKYNCLGDSTRMKTDLGFVPAFDSRKTVEDFFAYRNARRSRRNLAGYPLDPIALWELQGWLKARPHVVRDTMNQIREFNIELEQHHVSS